MVQRIAEDLLDFSRRELADGLRAVCHYDRESYNPIYLKNDLLEELDEETTGAFRFPYLEIHRGMWHLSINNDRFDDPEVIVHSYGSIQIIQFPVTRSEGIILSSEEESETITPLVAECIAIVEKHRPRLSGS